MSQSPSTQSVEALIDRYCLAWSDPDPVRRAALLGEVWAPDATYTDPTVHARGAAELLEHIGRVVTRRPGARVVRTSNVDVHHGIARFAWQLVQADGSALPDGLDIAELTPDGTRLARIVGFFGPLLQR
jgi:hypothetical protein